MMRLFDVTHENNEFSTKFAEDFAFAIRKIIVDKYELSEKDRRWYHCFVLVAVCYIKEECNSDDYNFESILKLARCTRFEPDVDSVFDILMKDWREKKVSIFYEHLISDWFDVRSHRPEKPVKRIREAIEMYKENVAFPAFRNDLLKQALDEMHKLSKRFECNDMMDSQEKQVRECIHVACVCKQMTPTLANGLIKAVDNYAKEYSEYKLRAEERERKVQEMQAKKFTAHISLKNDNSLIRSGTFYEKTEEKNYNIEKYVHTGMFTDSVLVGPNSDYIGDLFRYFPKYNGLEFYSIDERLEEITFTNTSKDRMLLSGAGFSKNGVELTPGQTVKVFPRQRRIVI